MFAFLKRIPSYKKIDPEIVNKLIDRVNTLSKITTSGGISVQTSPTGIHLHNSLATVQFFSSKIFEITTPTQWALVTPYLFGNAVYNDGKNYSCKWPHTSSPLNEPGTGVSWTTYWIIMGGDGIYAGVEQTLDATEWDDTDGDYKTDNLSGAVTQAIFNLMEHDPVGDYTFGLALGDLIKAWKWTDDEGNERWCGIPLAGGFARLAKTTAAAGAATTITANLYNHAGAEIESGLGAGITVNCHTTGGANLNAVLPYLADNQLITVYNQQGVWWCTTIFRLTEICT